MILIGYIYTEKGHRPDTQGKAAHFITGDYRSTIPSSSIKLLKKMKLQPQKECRQLLHLTLYYRAVSYTHLTLPTIPRV